jgi:hypothetical protein
MASETKSNGSVNGSAASVSSPNQSRQKSSSYPGYTLRQAEELAKAAFDSGARNCDQDKVAQAAKYSASGGAFKVLRSTAKQFGLIKLEKNGCLSVTDEWIEVFHHSDNIQLSKEARRKAILRPTLYKHIIEEFTNRQLPTVEKLTRELHLNQKYGILKDAAGNAARLFLESANYVGLLNEQGYLINPIQDGREEVKNDIEASNNIGVEGEEQNTEQVQREVSKNLNSEESLRQPENSVERMPPSLEGLDRHEITLINGKKAYLYVPVPLPYGEKERLKKYLGFISDLILEESPSSLSTQQVSDSLENGL